MLYQIAKENLGRHLTLNEAVPDEVGCAEAISYCLEQLGMPLPSGGIAGTASLLTFLEQSGYFTEETSGEPGDIIISATGTGNGTIEGHVGDMGINGIMSNDSASGLFLERWTLPRWIAYYQVAGGIPTRYFRPIG